MTTFYVMREADGDECLIWHAPTLEAARAWADANVPECERMRTSIWASDGTLHLLPRRVGWVSTRAAKAAKGG